MLKRLTIGSYRGLSNLTMENLGQINIIIGENNSGKTSILEAIQLFDYENVLSSLITIARRRETPLGIAGVRGKLDVFDSLFYSFDMKGVAKEIYLEADSDKDGCCRVGVRAEIEKTWIERIECTQQEESRYLQYSDEDGNIREMRGEYFFERKKRQKRCEFYFNELQRGPHIVENGEVKKQETVVLGRIKHIQYISPMDIYTNKIISASLYKGMLVDEKKRLLDLLQMFDERILGIETGIQYGKPVTFVEMEDCGLVPISIFGDGLKKILTLASAVIKMRDGILLIDEFETGIHKQALIQVARWLSAITERYGVQVFLTTHSSDAIDALLEASEDLDMLNTYRLEHYKSNIYIKKFEGNDLQKIKSEQGMDIL